jgi:conjugative transfer region protein TrbK
MDGKTIARIGAVAFVTLAIVATAVEMNRRDDPKVGTTIQAQLTQERDPLDAELARCSGIGEAGARDPSCLKAWVQARRRFLGRTAASTPETAPSAPVTLFPNAQSADPAKPATQAEPAPAPVPSDEGTR